MLSQLWSFQYLERDDQLYYFTMPNNFRVFNRPIRRKKVQLSPHLPGPPLMIKFVSIILADDFYYTLVNNNGLHNINRFIQSTINYGCQVV